MSKKIKKAAYCMMALMGFLFLTAYIRSATLDVVYTDYIRIINSYLADVTSFEPYLHGDILTRVLINYPVRIFNVYALGYSTWFDMLLGIIFLTISFFAIAKAMNEMDISLGWIIAIFAVVFALDKWEMITNGTGWVHFATFALMYIHLEIYNRERKTFIYPDGKMNYALIILPIVTILFVAGVYGAIYAATMTVMYAIEYVINKDSHIRKKLIIYFLAVFIPIVIFIISNSLAVEEHAGATDESFITVITTRPLTIISMVVKGFASMIIGGETATAIDLPGWVLWILGLIVIAAYIYAIVIYFREGIYKKSLLPIALIAAGLTSHGIVALSRWIFVDDVYAMSSRYALQFQSGIIGILMTFALYAKKKSGCDTKTNAIANCKLTAIVIAALTILFIGGRCITTHREIYMAQYRKEYFANMREVALNYENESDDTLKSILQYSKPDKTRDALKILEDNNLNIFRDGGIR